MTILSVLFGTIVGFSLGLTGGGGSIFAVPLLVYGLSVPAREAVGTSLAAVGATALFGAVQRLRTGEIDLRVGLLFAAAGMLGAPAGSWIGGRVPEPALLVIALVSASGVASAVAAGRALDAGLTLRFVAGGIIGMALGTLFGRRLSGPRLQQVFAAAIILTAVFVIARTVR